ncbi:TonB-dependent receptor [Phenylobacterium montanum]|uniref:TonB-dependent receptor n=1 Tax=Phenylobacterium montanum TaxID=2823693 RepID=A0A975FZ78_9CAUL|nr:TonB-dependent receptor [Caulobacter sp. S6]QUD87876.1 TonB-dependent receptor [Caulobacter sp. S6]
MSIGFRRGLMISVSAAVLTAGGAALAQTAPASAAAAPAADAAPVQEIIVTGTARTSGLNRLDAGFSITTANAVQIHEVQPSSTANLLKIVPGVFAETTGGTDGANIEVRGFPTGGDAQYVTIQLDGSPVYAVPTLSFLENSSIFRIDDTVKRVEVLRGGPAPIYSNGQPGVTMNFIEKNGETDPGGSLRLTAGSDELYRIDGYEGIKLAEGWYGSIGGFYRSAGGVRNPGFPADRGGQVVATLTHDLENGSVTAYVRHLDDDNTFYTSVPLLSSNGGHTISAFPGFDPLTGSLLGNELRTFTFPVAPGVSMTRDITKGRGASVTLGGVDYHQDFDAWHVSNKFNFTDGDTPTYALFNGANASTFSDYIAGVVSTQSNNIPAGTTGTGTYVDNGAAVDPNTQVIPIGLWIVDKHIKSVTDDLRVSRDLFEGDTLTAGVYFADYSATDHWYLGNTVLMNVQNHGRLIDYVLSNGAVGSLHGQVGPSFFALNASYNGRNIAGFVADEWNPTSKLKLDAGVRYEQEHITGSIENDSSIDLDGNPLTLYDNNASTPNGTFKPVDFTASHVSWTAGANYRVLNDLSVFARINSGFRLPDFDDLRSGLPQVETIKQYEGGVKTATSWYAANATFFYNTFKGEPFSQILSSGGPPLTETLASESYGLEVEGMVRPFHNAEIEASGNWQDSHYTDQINNGKQTQRQPSFQMRLTPSYTIPFDWGKVKTYLTYTHVGLRYADVQNTQVLPEYDTLDFGVETNIGDRWSVLLSGTNVTNTLAITEGNSRVLGSGVGNGGVFEGRPLFGAEYQVSVAVKF